MIRPLRQELVNWESNPRRILFACAAFPPNGKGGGPVSSFLFARGLASRGHTIRVVTVGDEHSIWEVDGIEVRQIPSQNIYWNYWKENKIYEKIIWHTLENFNPIAYFSMKREISNFLPDVLVTVSCENINVASWLAAHTSRVPTVHLIQSYFLLCWRGSMFQHGKNCDDWCSNCRATSIGKRFMTRYVDWVVANSNATLQEHISKGLFPRAGKKVIRDPVQMPSFAPSSTASRQGLSVGFLGAFDRVKGLETLAAVAKRLIDHPQIRFVIAGNGRDEDYDKLVRQSFPSANTTFLGWVDPAELFRQIDILAVPSLWREPYGRITIEARSYGVPAIVARSGGLAENISHECDGLVFEAGNDRELERLILRVFENPQLLEHLSRNTRATMDRYSVEAAARELDSVIDMAVTRAPGKERENSQKKVDR
jgi:glycosyltransferase involved in cell wall biosynthesis